MSGTRDLIYMIIGLLSFGEANLWILIYSSLELFNMNFLKIVIVIKIFQCPSWFVTLSRLVYNASGYPSLTKHFISISMHFQSWQWVPDYSPRPVKLVRTSKFFSLYLEPHVHVCIYIYVWKLNQTVLELDFRAVKFLFFPRRDLNPHHWYTAAPFA